jgi:hypothetical protein
LITLIWSSGNQYRAGHRTVYFSVKVPDDQVRKTLGTANVTFKQNDQRLAIIDSPLQG